VNGRWAKKLRKFVYGKDGSTKVTEYKKMSEGNTIADKKRGLYQLAKKSYYEGRF